MPFNNSLVACYYCGNIYSDKSIINPYHCPHCMRRTTPLVPDLDLLIEFLKLGR